MELTWGFCRKQALVLISCLSVFYLASFDTITSESPAQNATAFKNRSHKGKFYSF
ncbi:hypothetical protein F2Q70_00013740 [Brassica cretica]|uniref:Uncharacterized protein n=1 Tax=Brassica cretica TaxID=69181 RepID=A0A8S9LQJ4_BRACR|nr:hypothetical protein F2Q70_00013740 [Brassica cretica]